MTDLVPGVSAANNMLNAWGDGELDLRDFTSAAGLGLASLDMVFNPAEAIVSNALGVFTSWLLSNCEVFREVVDCVLGSPDDINRVADKYRDVGAKLADLGNRHADAVTATPQWTGSASEAYREAQRGINDNFRGAVKATDAIQGALRGAAVIVSVVREFLLALIQDLLAKVIVKALIAIASAIPTFGASIATGVSLITFDIGVAAARWSMKLAKLVRKMMKFCDKLGISTTMLRKIYTLLVKNAVAIRRGLQAGAHLKVGNAVANATTRAANTFRDIAENPLVDTNVPIGPIGSGTSTLGDATTSATQNQQGHDVREI